MRFYFLCFIFLGVFNGYSQDINLSLCDSIPADFYTRDYKKIRIENGQGYCESPRKVLDKQIKNLSNLQELWYFDRVYDQEQSTPLSLPKQLCKLKNLTVLRTNVISNEIFDLKQLKMLAITVNADSIGFFKNSFEVFTELEHLILTINGDDQSIIVNGIAQLEKLRTVELINPNQALINEVLANPYLENVGIARTYNKEFDFSNQKNLKYLSVNTCGLTSVPPSVYGLKNLESLALTYNKLSTVDGLINQLTKLKVLSLFHNHLEVLPDEIGECLNIEYIYLDYNRSLSSLPSTIGNLTKLKDLHLNNCNLTELPQSLNNCTDLMALRVNQNNLMRLDLDFSAMPNLVAVDAEKNQITYVNPGLFELPLLDRLVINDNQIKEIPASIAKMKSLSSMAIMNNAIVALPDDIGELKQLVTISAYNNNLTSVPASVFRCENLVNLYVGDNQIKQLPTGLDALINLGSLEIQDNPLTKFPVEIYSMPNLERVWVNQRYSKLEGFKETKENPIIIITDKRVVEDDWDFKH